MIRDKRSGDDVFENQFKADLEALKTSDKKDMSVSYLSWKKVKDGDDKKREVVHRVKKTALCSEAVVLMEQLYEDLQQHLDRNFTIKKTIREMVLSSKDKDHLHIDWAKNLDIEIPGEVQSAISILL